MESNPDTHFTFDIAHDDAFDIISMVPFELSHKIFSLVGDYKNAVLVCRHWKILVDDGIASGVLLRREEIALIELKPLGVRSLDITELDCDGKGFESIPHGIAALRNLKKLYLSGNAISGIFQAITALPNLEWLNLSENALVSIPETIGAFTNLTHLWLCYNQLESIPHTIGALTSLRMLALSVNQIASIPDTIGSLTNLRELYLHENLLTQESIPESIGGLSNLELLSLDNQKSGATLSRPPQVPPACIAYL